MTKNAHNPSQHTDHRYVNRVRRLVRLQYPLVLTTLLLGGVFLGGGFRLYTHHRNQARAVLDHPHQKLLQGTTREMAIAIDLDRAQKQGWLNGIETGIPIGATLAVGVLLVFLAVVLMFGGRKDKLLLKYFDHAEGTKQH